MKRITQHPRSGWQGKVESVGLTFHTAENIPYWDESAYYLFTAKEVDELEAATNALQKLYIDATEQVLRNNWLDRLAIPGAFHDLMRKSWDRDDPSIYGRFDLCYNGSAPPKLLEYNADSPTALVEAAVAQWYWLQDMFPHQDQFNSIHERLIESWKWLKLKEPLYFACIKDHEEDLRTIEYLVDTAVQAGVDARGLFIEDIGWNGQQFVDLQRQPLRQIFKLYPWEWLAHEAFGPHLLFDTMRVYEPPWKLLWSNKAMLPILWELFPDHPNLLPAYTSPERLKGDFVQKPIFSREGANITLRSGLRTWTTAGDYGHEGFIYQELCAQARFETWYPVLGSWVIGGEAAGIGIREDTQPITGNLSRFVPHCFTP